MVGGIKPKIIIPKTGYLGVLYRIQDKYREYFKDDNINISHLINYYNDKNKLNNKEIKDIQDACKSEWNSFLNKLLNRFIKRIGKKAKLFPKEIKSLNKLITRVQKNKLKIEDYENLYSKDIEILVDDISAKLSQHKKDGKRFWWGLFLGAVLGVIGSIVVSLLPA